MEIIRLPISPEDKDDMLNILDEWVKRSSDEFDVNQKRMVLNLMNIYMSNMIDIHDDKAEDVAKMNELIENGDLNMEEVSEYFRTGDIEEGSDLSKFVNVVNDIFDPAPTDLFSDEDYDIMKTGDLDGIDVPTAEIHFRSFDRSNGTKLPEASENVSIRFLVHFGDSETYMLIRDDERSYFDLSDEQVFIFDPADKIISSSNPIRRRTNGSYTTKKSDYNRCLYVIDLF